MALDTIRIGNAVYIQISTRDGTQNVPPLVNVTLVTITINRADGTLAVSNAPMTNVALGNYEYTYVTSTNDPVSSTMPVTAIFTCTGLNGTAVTDPVPLFYAVA